MDTNIVKECSILSFQNTPFAEIVKRLLGAGTERYICDLVGLKKYYFGTNDQLYVSEVPLEKTVTIPLTFDDKEIKEAIAAIQQDLISYEDFLKRIMNAGCSHYEVFLTGRKAIYFSRKGDSHVELFPSAK